MMTRIKGWEDIAETLRTEVKREIAEEYFSKKIFRRKLGELSKRYQRTG